MSSKNERQRWAVWYDQVAERMANQKQAITRLVLVTTQQRAALLEIAHMPKEVGAYTVDDAASRAQDCLDLTAAYATAVPQQAEELRDEPDPEDPRRRK